MPDLTGVDRTIKRGFGWDVERESEIPWRIARKLRLPLSKWLRIGQWFATDETCRKCGIEAGDAEYAFRRVGFGKAECLPDFGCDVDLLAGDDERGAG